MDIDEEKREEALRSLKSRLDEAVDSKKAIVGIRMNLSSLGYLFDDDIMLIKECSIKDIGEEGWPPGAIISMGGAYGKNSFLYLDNNLADGEIEIDYE